jgi:phosphoglycerate kinase
MMENVLKNGTADHILTCGLTGEIMLLAEGHKLGQTTESFIADKGLSPFIEQSKKLLAEYGDKILYPTDLAYVVDGERREIGLNDLPADHLLMDIGQNTISRYIELVECAETIFINGPVGVYEKPGSDEATSRLWNAIADAPGYSVIGGGDSVASAKHFNVADKMSYVCTAGGAMVRFTSGRILPVVDALQNAAKRTE